MEKAANSKEDEAEKKSKTETDIYKKLTELDQNEIFELILEKIGGFGSFQKILWVVGLLSCFLGYFKNHK